MDPQISNVADFGPVRVYFGDRNGKYPDGNQVVVRGGDTLAVFDTPVVSNFVGTDVDDADLVILGHVHEDHMAGLHRVPRAAVHVHEADLMAARSWEGLKVHYGYPADILAGFRHKIEAEFNYVPRPDAVAYSDGAVWDLGGGVRVRAFHRPGHTAGHCVLLVEPVGVAFIGDIDLSSFGPYYGDATSSLSDFRRTLASVASIPASTWVTSHHKGAVTDRAEFLRALAFFAGRLDDREARLLELLSGPARSIDELVVARIVYKPEATDSWVEAVERRSIEQHLRELLDQGRVIDEGGRYRKAR